MSSNSKHEEDDKVWRGKPGSADELIKGCANANFVVRGPEIAVKPRVLSDGNGGRTDRVAMEMELED
jgi:hypothetical protein